ncbi:MAG: hypothetical protein JRN21_04920 [Nitrososphaerota archaeon]|nr:hypothetical protein [Nitrososphaerota archaeon]
MQVARSVSDPATCGRETGAPKEVAEELGADKLTVVTSREGDVFRVGGKGWKRSRRGSGSCAPALQERARGHEAVRGLDGLRCSSRAPPAS